MRSLIPAVAGFTILVAGATWGTVQALESHSATPAVAEAANTADSNIAELASQTEALSTLLAAVKAAGLAETLSGEGPFTVFAPTNEAFAKLPRGVVASLLEPRNRDQLVRILTYHVVAGKADSATALAKKEFDTVAGPKVQIALSGGQLKVNNANVVINDIVASNGVVHVIDTVLLPPDPKPTGPNANRIDLFVLAIERGAPLFNEGSPAACAAIYEIAVTSVLGLSNDLDQRVRSTLETAITQSAKQSDPTDRAWTLRGAMDRSLQAWMEEPAKRASAGDDSRAHVGMTVFGFDEDNAHSRWASVNDDVMGGISQSRFERSARGTAFFRGALSMENNGGFATVRSPGRNLELEEYDGVIMRVRGDGRRYGFSVLPSDRRFEVNIWRTDFQTRAGEWQEIKVPFDSMVKNVMGRRMAQDGPLPASRIRSIGFSISDKNEAPFSLEVDWIRAYRDGAPSAF